LLELNLDTVPNMENTSTQSVVQPAIPTKIQVNNLNFHYGNFHALRNVNMSIAENKVTAFIGPSGCGKSTLLRTFNRMFELYPGQRAEGEIILDGENLLTTKPIYLCCVQRSVWCFKNPLHSL